MNEKTEVIHITEIRNGHDVWGHSGKHCDPAGCAAGADRYYKLIDADEVEVGHAYEVNEWGTILAEMEE